MIGTTVGAYRVIAALGKGGMGEVYRAEDLRLHRHVALKVLPPGASASDTNHLRFLQEARAASALSDPHIVTVYDIFTVEGTDFLVMELVPGRTLRALLDEGPLSTGDVLDWVAQTADALAVAHAAGIVHRDLKPSNLMVTDRGLVKVLDFGIAKITAGQAATTAMGLTVVGDLVGTIDYMSPEQVRGEAVDQRSDIFSLGIVLYEALTGARPFRGNTAVTVLQRILSGAFLPVHDVKPGVDRAVDTIVLRALAGDPKQRYQSMQALSADLRAARATLILPPDAVAPGDRFRSDGAAMPATAIASDSRVHTRSRPGRLAGWLAALFIAVLVAAAVAVWQWRRPSPTAVDAVASSTGTGGGRRGGPSDGATALEHTQRGLKLLVRFDDARHVGDAISAFDAAIASDRTYAAAWAWLARACWRQQRITADKSWSLRSLDAAREAVKLDPSLADGHVSLGFASLMAGDRQTARTAFDQALVLSPANPDAHRGLGDLAQTEGRLDDAAPHYRRALELAPANVELQMLTGTLLWRAGRHDEALTWYEKASAAAPDNASVYMLIGAAHHARGDYPAAATAFQRSIGLRPTAGGYTNLATVLFFQGKYRDALPAFERAVELMPATPLYWANLGDGYRWVPGHREQSQQAYMRAIQQWRTQLTADPSHVVNRSRLALALAKAGDLSEALEELSRVPWAKAEDINTMYRSAVIYELAGQRDAALRALEAALGRGYPFLEVETDPELAALRGDVRYHRLLARFERKVEPVP